MKYYYINKIQTLNVGKLFKDYCNEHYIPFLESSRKKKFKKRFKKLETEQDKQRAIDKFVRMNEYRIHILLSSLYAPSLNKGCRWTEAYYMEQSSRYQQDILTIEYRKFFISFGINAKLIGKDILNNYVSLNAGLPYTRCYRYRVCPELYNSHHKWQKNYRLRLPDKFYDSLLNKDKAKYNTTNTKPKPSEFGLKMNEYFKKWKLDEESIPEELYPYLEKYHKQDFLTDNYYKEGRFYHPLNLMKKELRKYLYHIDKNEEYQIVEISNSHQYFFSTYLVGVMELGKEQIAQVNSIGEMLQEVAKKRKKELCRDFASVIKNKTLSEFYRLLEFKYKTDLNTDLIEFEDEERRQLTIYVLMAILGITYDVLMEFTPNSTDRNQIKREVSMMLNKGNEYNWSAYGVDRIYIDYFYEVYKVIMTFKKYHHSNFGIKMSKFESEFIRTYEKELYNDDIMFLDIFDGIMVSKDIAPDLLTKMANGSKKKYGLTAPLKIDAVA